MAIESHGTLNIENPFAKDMMAPAAGASFVNAGARIEVGAKTPEQLRVIGDALGRLEAARRALAASNLPDDQKVARLQDIDQAEALINGGTISVEQIANLMTDLNSKISNDRFVSNQNTSAAIFDAIDDARRLSVTGRAIVQQQFNYIVNGDWDKFRASVVDELPNVAPEQKPAILAAQNELAKTPQGARVEAEMEKLAKDDPEALAKGLARGRYNREVLDAAIEKYKDDPELLKLLVGMRNSGAYHLESATPFIEAVAQGKTDPVELKQLAEPAITQTQQAMAQNMDGLFMMFPKEKETILGRLSPEKRAELEKDPRGMAKHVWEEGAKISDADYNRAMDEFRKHGGKWADLSEGTRYILSITNVQNAMGSQMASLGILSHARDIRPLLDVAPEMLTEKQRESLANFATVRDSGKPMAERVEAMMEGTLANGDERMGKVLNGRNKASNMALATMTLAYADANGGIDMYMQQAVNMQSPDAKVREKATAYFNGMTAYMSTTLLGTVLDPRDPANATRLTATMNEFGEALLTNQVVATVGQAGEMVINNRLSGEQRSSYYTVDNFFDQYMDAKRTLDTLYKETSKRSPDEIMSQSKDLTVMWIDTLRLYDRKDGQDLIMAMANGKISEEEAMTKAYAMVKDTAARMDTYGDSIVERLRDELDGGKTKHFEALKRLGAIDTDGHLDVGAVMNGALEAKYKFQSDYKQFKDWSLDELLAGKKGKETITDGQERYEARLMYQVATQLYATQSFDSVSDIGKNLETIKASGQRALTAAEEAELKLFSTVNDPKASTGDRKQALRTLLSRDEYLLSRSDLLKDTVEMMMDHIRDHEKSGTAHGYAGEGHPEGHDHDELPVKEAVAAVVAPAASPVVAGNEALRAAVLNAISGLDESTRQSLYAQVAVAPEAVATVAASSIADKLVQANLTKIEDIKDVNGNGLDDKDIAAALTVKSALTPSAGNALS